MDEKQLQLLWDSFGKNQGFSSFGEFKELMNDSNSRKVFFDDANPDLGFKDYNEFETLLGVKKKEPSTSSIGQSQSSEKGIANRFPFNLLIQGKVAQDEEMSFKTNDPLSFAKRKKIPRPQKKESIPTFDLGKGNKILPKEQWASEHQKKADDPNKKSVMPEVTAAIEGLGSVGANLLKTIAIASKNADWFNEYEGKKAEDLATYKAGKWLEGITKDVGGEISDTDKEKFGVKLSQGLGQASGFMLGGWGSKVFKLSVPLTTATLGAATAGATEYEAAIQAGATDEQANKAFWLNMGVGATEALPIMAVFRRLDKYTGGLATKGLASKLSSTLGGRLTSDMVNGFVQEAAQEAVSQMLTNVIAANTYDKVREVFDGVLESGAIGGIIGGTMSAAAGSIREKRKTEKLSKKEDAQLAAAQEFAEKKAAEANDPSVSEIEAPTNQNKKVQELQKQKTKLESDLASNQQIPQSGIDAINAKISSIDEEIELAKKEVYAEELKTIESGKLSDKIKENEELLKDESLSEETREVIQKEIDKAKSELATLEGKEAEPTFEQKVEATAKALDNKIDITRERGGFVGDFLNDYELIGEGSEHTVYRSKDGSHVIRISEPYNDKSESTLNARINDAMLISEILGDGSLEVIGYYESQNGTKNPIYRQKFQEGTPISEQEAVSYLQSIGAIEYGDKYNRGYLINYNGKWYKISDLTDNFFKNKNGEINAIDAAIQEISQKEISEAYHKAKADGSNPELVKAVEDVLGTPSKTNQPIQQNESAAKEQGVETAVPKGTIATGQGNAEPPATVLEEGAPKETIVSHAGMQEVADDFALGDVTVRDPVSDKQDAQSAFDTASKWNEEGTYAQNINKLLTNIENGHGSNPVEKHILQNHIANVRAEADRLSDDILSKEYQDKINELDRLKRAGATLKSTAGATLRNSTIKSVENPTMADWMADLQETKGSELTDAEKQNAADMFKEYEQKLKEANEKREAAEVALAESEAKLKVREEERKQRTIKRKQSNEQLKEEREDILKNIKDKWKGAGKDKLSSDIPYRQQIAAIAPDVARLAKSYIKTGINNLSEIVDTIHAAIKGDIPDLTKRDIIDIIAGKYDSSEKKTKTQYQEDLKKVRDEAKEISNEEENLAKERERERKKAEAEANRLEKEAEREKETQEKARKNKEAKEQRAEQKRLSQKSDGEKKLEAAKNRALKQAKDIEEKIKNKDFEPKKKSIPLDQNEQLRKSHPQAWKDMMDANVARDEAKAKLESEKRKFELAKRSGLKKALDFVAALINTSKAVVAGIDDSSTFVQLGLAVLANPKKAALSKIEALKDINNNRFKRRLAALHESPLWKYIEASKLSITEPSSMTKDKVEELYSGNLLDKKIGGINYWTYTGGIFERMFTSMGNNLRLKMFEARVKDLLSEGKTLENNLDEFTSAASVINNMTGRGNVHESLQTTMPAITPFIWAPKMMASSFNILGAGDALNAVTGTKGYYASLTPAQRKYAFTQLATGIGTGVAIMASLAIAGWDTEEDPHSTNFGTVTTPDGNTSYNVFGRYANTARTIVQVATGKSKSFDDKEIDLDKSKGGTKGVIGKFIRGKMTPAAGIAFDYFFNAKRNSFTNEKITAKKAALQLITPISMQGITKMFEQDGTMALLTRWLPAFEGLQVRDKRDFVDDLETLIERNADADTQDQSKIFNYKEGGEKPITDEQFDNYNEKRNEKITKAITDMYNNGSYLIRESQFKKVPYKEMTKEEIYKETSRIKSKATEITKKELFGEKKKTRAEKRDEAKLKKKREREDNF